MADGATAVRLGKALLWSDDPETQGRPPCSWRPARTPDFIAEIAQHHALRISVISAAGTLFFGLCADRDAVADLDVLSEGLDEARDALLRQCLN
jgi:hypothetical protein